MQMKLLCLILCGILNGDLYINQTVVDLHTTLDELNSQVPYGTKVFLKQDLDETFLIQAETGEEGIIFPTDVIELKEPPAFNAKVNILVTFVHSLPSVKQKPFMKLLFQTPVITLDQKESNYVKIKLLDGTEGWIRESALQYDLKPLTLPEILTLSQQFLGRPYYWGGASSDTLDCSGFMKLLFYEAGIILPHSARKQSQLGENVIELKPGDLLFFGRENATHVGLYLGNQEFIHATPPAVRINQLDDYWNSILIAKRRLMN